MRTFQHPQKVRKPYSFRCIMYQIGLTVYLKYEGRHDAHSGHPGGRLLPILAVIRHFFRSNRHVGDADVVC